MIKEIELMKMMMILAVAAIMLILSAAVLAQTAEGSPQPVLQFDGTELNEWQGRMLKQYKFEVLNRTEFPDELFTLSPELPPCGLNKRASRTWMNIYADGRRIYGYCAFENNEGLAKFGFNLDPADPPPAKVYIELVDRKTGTIYRSKKVKIVP
jgi:hypothetical protein